MTREEFEDLERRLAADIEDARKVLNAARDRFDRLCEEARILRYGWRDQQKKEQQR